MESGDIIDAHLEQVRAGVTLPFHSFSQIPVTRHPHSSEAGIDAGMSFLLVPP